MSKPYSIDMCSGPLGKKILIFTLPLMAANVLQMMFNLADVIVVGKFAGDLSQAAVTSTTSMINLLLAIFMGLSGGANVVVAQALGARENEQLEDIVHTCILLGLVCGVGLMGVGILISPGLLALIKSPDNVKGLSLIYLRIYFFGVPATLVYNFASAILRANGDTKRPMYFLILAGIINVILNLISVIGFGMGVAGVAIATVVSQVLSAILVVGCLARSNGCYRLDFKALRLHRDKVFEIMRVGIPAGLQSTMFSISNVLIQSSINSFGSVVMAANSASQNLGGFVNASVNVFSQACTTFASQNLGAKNYKRLDPILATCCGCIMVVGLIMSLVMLTFGERLLGIYTTDPEVIATGMIRIRTVPCLYFLLAVTNAMGGFLQAIGYNMVSTGVSMAGICGLRVAWVTFIWPLNPTLPWLYMSYPASWIVTGTIMFTCTRLAKRHLFRKAGVQ